MRFKKSLSSIAALALIASPAAFANPAAGLSVAQARVGGSTEGDSALSAPGAGIGLVLAALVIAGGIYLIVDDEDDPDSP